MSELKARHIVDVYDSYYAENPFGERSQVYLKSEADKVIEELEEKLKAQTSIAEEGWKEAGTYHTSYAEAVKELYDKNKELRHHKYKRCLAMAKLCVNGEIKLKRVKMRDMNNHQFWQFDNNYWQKWNTRWLKIAEQFKDKEA